MACRVCDRRQKERDPAMLLKTYTRDIFRPACNPRFRSVHCIARLDQDVGAALPYLNAELGGFTYTREPPSVTFKIQGRLISVHADRIAINALEDAAEADRILRWLQREINAAWERRGTITPCYTGQPRPGVLDILKKLPRTNCRECGQPTCMVMAVRLAEGAAAAADCPALAPETARQLDAYLQRFDFDR